MARTTPTKTVPPKHYVYDGVVLGIHDGDTVKVAVKLAKLRKDSRLGDFGFHVFIEELTGQHWLTLHTSFRLLGINAPELNTVPGKAALAYIKTLLEVGELVQVRSSVNTKGIDPDKYGDRWLGVIINSDGLVVNDEMVQAGHAKAWDGQGAKPV